MCYRFYNFFVVTNIYKKEKENTRHRSRNKSRPECVIEYEKKNTKNIESVKN